MADFSRSIINQGQLEKEEGWNIMATTWFTFCLDCLHSLQARPDTVPGARRLRIGSSVPPPPLSPLSPAPPLSLAPVASVLVCRVEESLLLSAPAFDIEEFDELGSRSREGARFRYVDMMKFFGLG